MSSVSEYRSIYSKLLEKLEKENQNNTSVLSDNIIKTEAQLEVGALRGIIGAYSQKRTSFHPTCKDFAELLRKFFIGRGASVYLVKHQGEAEGSALGMTRGRTVTGVQDFRHL